MRGKAKNFKSLLALFSLILVLCAVGKAKAEEVYYVDDIYTVNRSGINYEFDSYIDFGNIDKVEIGYVTDVQGSFGGCLGYFSLSYDWYQPNFTVECDLAGEKEGTLEFDEIGGVGDYMQLQLWWLSSANGEAYFSITYIKAYNAEGEVIYYLVDEDPAIRIVESLEVYSGSIGPLYANCDGYYNSEDEKYFVYNYSMWDLTLQINYSDGSYATAGVYDVVNGMEFKYVDNQDVEHWGVGSDNYVTIEYYGKELSVPVTILENPVDHIEVVTGTSYTPIENYDGSISERYNDETGEYEEFFVYYFGAYKIEDAEIKIVYKDGTSVTASVGSYVGEYQIDVYDNQYDEPWSVGSDNYVIIEYMGHEVELPITVIENPVDYIELVTGTSYALVENYGGYISETYNEETGEWEEFFEYDFGSYLVGDAVIRIVYKDGTSVTANVDSYVGDYWIGVSTNQFDKPWRIGSDNYAIIEYMEHEVELPITVIENPVDHIELVTGTSYTPIENWDGFVSERYNDETGEYEEFFEYSFSAYLVDDAEIKIAYKDGTSAIVNVTSGVDDYGVWAYDDQYNDPWSVGSDNCAIIEYMGHEVELPITVTAYPIESMKILQAPTKAHLYGEYMYGDFAWMTTYQFDVQKMNFEGLVIEFTYADGSKETVKFEELTRDEEEHVFWYKDLKLSFGGDYGYDTENNVYPVTVFCLNESQTFDVPIYTEEVSSIEVLNGPDNCENLRGEYADLTGMRIRVVYASGKIEDVTLDEENIDYSTRIWGDLAYVIECSECDIWIGRDPGYLEDSSWTVPDYIITCSETSITYTGISFDDTNYAVDFELISCVAEEDISTVNPPSAITGVVHYADGTTEEVTYTRIEGVVREGGSQDAYLYKISSGSLCMISTYMDLSTYDAVYFIRGRVYTASELNAVRTVPEDENAASDVDDDGDIDSDDAIYLLYHSLLPEEYPLSEECKPDFDGNNTVDSDDAIYLLYYTLLPEEYPLKNE